MAPSYEVLKATGRVFGTSPVQSGSLPCVKVHWLVSQESNYPWLIALTSGMDDGLA